jgi:tricarballylate dehydrogenase
VSRRSSVDVLVLGGGNAGLCAALSAREQGASVVVIECAPREFRGGNSRHTRNLRCMHDEPLDVLTGAYSEHEYFSDLMRVTGGETNQNLARLTILESPAASQWMRSYGARFQPSLGGTLHLGRTNAFFLGGGKALMNTWYAAARRHGIEVLYNAEVVGLDISNGLFQSAAILLDGRMIQVRARAMVAAAGGFEANLEWLREAWGDAALNFIVRGSPHNKGKVLKLLLDSGCEPVGDPKQCHCVAVDGRAPKFDGGIVTRLDCLPLGIVVNKNGERFYDEGEDLWPKRYAIWGRLVAEQPDQIAWSIVDQKVRGRYMPSVFPAIEAGTIWDLAVKLGLPADDLAATVGGFNAAVEPGAFDHEALDGCRTRGLAIDKTNWAQRLDTPPFLAYPLRPGITFTYLGVRVDEHARVSRNIYAAGEIMAGNILGKGYLAGFGMTIGTVFGRIAGREAARGIQ